MKICVVSNLGTIVASLGAPSDLVTSEVTARGFRVSWTHAPGKVEKYRVVYYPTRGGQPEEVIGGKAPKTFLIQQQALTRQKIPEIPCEGSEAHYRKEIRSQWMVVKVR